MQQLKILNNARQVNNNKNRNKNRNKDKNKNSSIEELPATTENINCDNDEYFNQFYTEFYSHIKKRMDYEEEVYSNELYKKLFIQSIQKYFGRYKGYPKLSSESYALLDMHFFSKCVSNNNIPTGQPQ